MTSILVPPKAAVAASAPVREYIGKAWKNKVPARAGVAPELVGREFISVKFDRQRNGSQLPIADNIRLELWHNNSKREGKIDADFNVRVVSFTQKAAVTALRGVT